MAEVLVVEDDEDIALLIELFLARAGRHVRRGRNGEEGLVLMAEALPDVVVLDIEMPLLDGPGMAARVLVDDAGRERVPIVLVSGAVGLPAIAERVGTPYSLAKPCEPLALLALVAKALAERRFPQPVVPRA